MSKFEHIDNLVGGARLGELQSRNSFGLVAVGKIRKGRMEIYFTVKDAFPFPCTAWDTKK